MLDRPDGVAIGRCSPHDDPETRELRRFLIEYNRHSPRTRNQLISQYPGLWFAYELYQSEDDERIRHYVEARILARQTDEEIARKIGAFPGTIKWYEACFYNVRDRFASSDWIVRQILSLTDGVGEYDVVGSYATLKLFGYFAGPVVVDAMISGFAHDRAPEDIKEVEEFYEDFITNAVKQQSVMGIRALNVDSSNVMQLLNICAKLVELRRSIQDGEGTFTSIEQNINLLWAEIQPIVGTKRDREGDDALLIDLDEEAAELRDDDLRLIGSSRATPDDEARIKAQIVGRQVLEDKRNEERPADQEGS